MISALSTPLGTRDITNKTDAFDAARPLASHIASLQTRDITNKTDNETNKTKQANKIRLGKTNLGKR